MPGQRVLTGICDCNSSIGGQISSCKQRGVIPGKPMNPYIVVRCCVCMPYISQLWSLGHSPTLIQRSTVHGTRIVIHNSISLWNKMCVIFIRRYFDVDKEI